MVKGETTLKRTYLYLGACSEVVLSRPDDPPLVGYIERDSDSDRNLHIKAGELEDEDYLHDFACELNNDYFDNELSFTLRWSHTRVATAGHSRGVCNYRHGKVISGGKIIISYLIAEHAYSATEDVVEYLLMHEMAHQVEMNHSGRFWKLVAQNPAAVRGYELYHARRDFPYKTHTLLNAGRVDPRSRGDGYLATGGYPEGEVV